MANLKFYKMATAPVGTVEKPLEAGAIWFNTTNHSIEVYNGATWAAYSGVLDAVVANEVLTVTKHDGSTVSVDFSIYATDEALELLTGRVSTLEGTVATQGGNITDLQGRMTTVEGKAKANEDKLAGLSETTVMAEIAKQVAAEAEIARKAEGDLVARVEPLETASADYAERIADLESNMGEGGSVDSQIDAKISAYDTNTVQPGLAAKADKATYEAYVQSNDERVAAVEKEIDDEVLRATTAEAGLQKQIGSGFSESATVAAAVKSAQDAADAAQKTIDDFLTGEGVDPNAVDSLKEIISYMETHGTQYEDVVKNLDTLNTDVATLQDKVDVEKVSTAISTAKGEAVTAANGYTDEKIAAEVLRADGKYEEKGVAAGLVNGLAERVAANELAVGTTLPAAIATAKSEAIAEATRLDGVLEGTLKTYAEGEADAAEAAAKGYADNKVKALADGAVATNTAAIAALDAKVAEGFAWVMFE